MLINDLLQYKITEGTDCIVISHSNITAKIPGAEPLIIAPAVGVAEYLARYFYARGQGKDLKTAHAEALQGAKIINRGHLDNPLGDPRKPS